MIPRNALYMNKLESAGGRQYTSSIPPQNGTGNYGPNSTCRINIPTTPNTVLVGSESYLKFTLSGITNGATANPCIRLDSAGGHSCIQRTRITNGSTEIQDIDGYANLVSLMMALQQSSDSYSGKQSIMAGTCPGMVTNNGETYVSTVGDKLSAYGANVVANAVLPDRTFCINLVNFLGSLSSERYIPLFAMTSSALTLELSFVSSALQFLCCNVVLASGNFIIKDVEFMGTFIEFSDEALMKVNDARMGEPLQYVIQNYANVQSSITVLHNTATSVSIPVSAKYKSLKSLFLTMRENSAGLVRRFPLSKTHYNINQWRLRIGSQLVPSKAPNSIQEHYCELLKAIGSLSDVNHEPAINKYNYDVAQPANCVEGNGAIVPTAMSCNFALGFDCETYANSDRSAIYAGMDTINNDVYWNIDFKAAALAGNANANVAVDMYALYDSVLVFENGTVRVIK
jgi:hypothetical protein